MNYNNPKLFIKIDNSKISIVAADVDDQSNLELLETLILPIEDINDNKILNLENVSNQIKQNILIIEQKIKVTFKDFILIINNFNISFLNLTGYKLLNGSQISKENIIYIINSLKSCVDVFEEKKKILHIFNSAYYLDKKRVDNIPIGLFGDFYSHELSFNLINKNDYKNIKKIFDNCKIKIKKILTDSFVNGTIISNKYPSVENFFRVQLGMNSSKIFYIENDSTKFEQTFKFGSNMVAKDISKITSLNIDEINKIIESNPFLNKTFDSELLEKKYFNDNQYRKIKKSLILEIANARIKEFSEILYDHNVNFKKFLEKVNVIYLEIEDQKHTNCFQESYLNNFSSGNKFLVKVIKKPELVDLIDAAYKITQFGWKKEAIPITKETGSFITRFFRTIFS